MAKRYVIVGRNDQTKNKWMPLFKDGRSYKHRRRAVNLMEQMQTVYEAELDVHEVDIVDPVPVDFNNHPDFPDMVCQKVYIMKSTQDKLYKMADESFTSVNDIIVSEIEKLTGERK